MVSLRSLTGLLFVLAGLGLFSFKEVYASAPVIGFIILIFGIVILFTNRDINTKDAGYGWHGGQSGDD